MSKPKIYDAIIIGGGVSGSFIAERLQCEGVETLMLEGGKFFSRTTYPTKEIDANAQLYWSGGIELNKTADLAFLRPKVVGGGSIVNQALLDRFDEIALNDFYQTSKVPFFNLKDMDFWYGLAEKEFNLEYIPSEFRNNNALIFQEGFEKNGYQYASLRRGQDNCRYEEGNDCIECLCGCRIDSKQSTPITVLKKALKRGLEIRTQFEVIKLDYKKDFNIVEGKNKYGLPETYRCRTLVMAAGAIGNSKILLRSGLKKKLQGLGENFYTHPQYMMLGFYDNKINAHKGPLQSLKSDDPNFRKAGFKLENVFGPPVAISLLINGFGKKHLSYMKRISQVGCIEVAIRDTNPGRITLNSKGKAIITKILNREDRKRKKKGIEAIENIFHSTGCKEIVKGDFGIGLHLMGGCAIGVDDRKSVVNPDFQIHGFRNTYIADSSIFPNAPGINPELTIASLSKMAASKMLKEI